MHRRYLSGLCLVISLLTCLVGRGLIAAAQSSQNPACGQSGIHHLVRPYYPDLSASGETFDYTYLQVRKPAPGYLTILFLTGGPGASTIEWASIFAKQFPQPFGLVLLDPRGVGCNQPPKNKAYPLDFYSTKNLALDTLAVIQDLGLSDYALYGGSYGSMLAMVVAGIAERKGESQPTAIVLEGVMGRAFKPMEVFDGYIEQWERRKAELSASMQTEINKKTLLGGISSEAWGTWISQQVLFTSPFYTASPKPYNPFLVPLGALMPGATNDQVQALREDIEQIWKATHHPEPNGLTLYQAIACREIFQEGTSQAMDADFDFESGRLVPIVSNLCRSIPMDRPFRAEEWQTTSPIYYFVGLRDPSTPPFQAYYNLAAEPLAERYFVEVPDAGHAALDTSLSDCSGDIWQSINDRGAGLGRALSSCNFGTRFRYFGRGETPASP